MPLAVFDFSPFVGPLCTILGVGFVSWLTGTTRSVGDKHYPSLDTFNAKSEATDKIILANAESADKGIAQVAADISALEQRSMSRYIENKSLYERLDQKIEGVEQTTRTSLHSIRNDMNAGFLNLTKALADGVMALTREVAIMQGRLLSAPAPIAKPQE